MTEPTDPQRPRAVQSGRARLIGGLLVGLAIVAWGLHLLADRVLPSDAQVASTSASMQQDRAAAMKAAQRPVEPASVAPVAPPPKPAPRYALQDGGRYGYQTALSEIEAAQGKASGNVLLFAYLGQRKGMHQLMPMTDADMRSRGPDWTQTYDWKAGERFIVRRVFHRGVFDRKEFIAFNPRAVLSMAMLDADEGHLQRYVHKANPKRHAYLYCDEVGGCGGDAVK